MSKDDILKAHAADMFDVIAELVVCGADIHYYERRLRKAVKQAMKIYDTIEKEGYFSE